MDRDTDRRRFLRFMVPLKIELSNSKISGIINDFSREGLKATFNDFPFDQSSQVTFQVQRPNKDIFIQGSGEVVWKSNSEQNWEVGIKLHDFPSEFKVEILDHAYEMWIKDHVSSQA